jgi:C_GCAxxG_C_C family probable redox protein
MKRSEVAVATFKQGFNCAQAVLSAYAGLVGLELEKALRVATGFGGGLGRRGEACGAVTGAIMVLGLKFGSGGAEAKTPEERLAEREKVYELVQRFLAGFQARHQSIDCRDLLGCDISNPEGYRRARAEQLFVTRCPKFVQSAAEVLEELL